MSEPRGMGRRWLRLVSRVLAWALVLYAIVAARSWWEARRELALGQAALGARDEEAAVRHLGRALRWYTPGSAANGQAAGLLFDLGRQAEAAGDPVTALAAYRELRGGIHAIRTLWTPHARWLGPADERIAFLMAGQGTVNAAGREVSFAEREAEHLALLRQDRSPDPWLSLLVVVSFLAWVGAAFAGIHLGLDPAGRLVRRPLAACAACGVPAFALWLVGLWLA